MTAPTSDVQLALTAARPRTPTPPAADGPPRAPLRFPDLERGLVATSGRAVSAHLAVYGRAWRELDSILAEGPRAAWTAPAAGAGVAPEAVERVLSSRVRELDLRPAGVLADCLAQLRAEMRSRGITWFPNFYIGDGDFWTTDRATSVNVPWFLADPLLWWLVNDQTTRYTHDELMMVLRHEAAHAVGYAFELWKRSDWGETFGDFDAPYGDAYDPDPESQDFVRHLHRSGPAANSHYAQKHADEDWAETFATWLAPGDWKAEYEGWPGALAKLTYVDRLVTVTGAAYGDPPNARPGKTVPYTQVGYTVREWVGAREAGAWSPASALLRAEPAARVDVALHEAYFEQLRRGGARAPYDLVAGAARAKRGSVDAWLARIRAVAGSVGAAGGWAVTHWVEGEGLVDVLVGPDGAGVVPGAPVILAVCLHEHAFAPDHGARRDLGLAAFFRDLDWAVPERRILSAVGVSRPSLGAP